MPGLQTQVCRCDHVLCTCRLLRLLLLLLYLHFQFILLIFFYYYDHLRTFSTLLLLLVLFFPCSLLPNPSLFLLFSTSLSYLPHHIFFLFVSFSSSQLFSSFAIYFFLFFLFFLFLVLYSLPFFISLTSSLFYTHFSSYFLIQRCSSVHSWLSLIERFSKFLRSKAVGLLAYRTKPRQGLAHLQGYHKVIMTA